MGFPPERQISRCDRFTKSSRSPSQAKIPASLLAIFGENFDADAPPVQPTRNTQSGSRPEKRIEDEIAIDREQLDEKLR
jgi:hypothetical protein